MPKLIRLGGPSEHGGVPMGGGQITQQSAGPRRQVEQLRADRPGRRLAGRRRRYRIELSSGGCLEGRSDAQGRTQLASSNAMDIATITLFDD
jgi:uncharacterized protein (DUF2345 family)